MTDLPPPPPPSDWPSHKSDDPPPPPPPRWKSSSADDTGWFVGVIVALALLVIAYLVFSANALPSTPVKAGPMILTDSGNIAHDPKTGCDYVETRSGAITPRMDANGKQVCS